MTLKTVSLNLKVLSRVPAHGRLRKSLDGVLSIESESLYSSIRRFVCSEGRERAIRDISLVVDEVEEKARDLLDNRHLDCNSEVQRTLKQLCEDVSGACVGLQNLRDTTYTRDAIITSQLDLLLARLRNVTAATSLEEIPSATPPSED